MCHKPWHHAKVTGREVRFARAPTSSSVSGGAKRGAERSTQERLSLRMLAYGRSAIVGGGSAGAGGYEFAQLASHPAVIVVPYTKSTMTFFELYRIGIPIFVPSLSLLTKWELQQHVMSERVYWKHTPNPLHPPNSAATPDPNALPGERFGS